MKRKQPFNVVHRVTVHDLVHHVMTVNARSFVHVTECGIVLYPRRTPLNNIARMTGYAYDLSPEQVEQNLANSVASPDPRARIGELETKLDMPVTRAHASATITCMTCAIRSTP